MSLPHRSLGYPLDPTVPPEPLFEDQEKSTLDYGQPVHTQDKKERDYRLFMRHRRGKELKTLNIVTRSWCSFTIYVPY